MTDLADSIAVLGLAADRVNETATILPDPETALRLLYQLRQAIETARKVDALLVTYAYTHGEHGDVRLEGLPAAKVQRGRDRKAWDARSVVQDVLDRRMETNLGEVPSDVWTVAEWILEVLGVGYVRVTPLRALGLEPDSYCESSPGNISVQFID